MLNISLDAAKLMVKEISNGVVEGIDSGKGGRAWLTGEFQLMELEALCVVIRAQAGKSAEGAEEFLKNMGVQ